MFKLINTGGETVLKKDGTPFLYTVKWTAELGRKFLEPELKTRLKVVPA